MLAQEIVIAIILLALMVGATFYMYKAFISRMSSDTEETEKSVHELEREY